MSDLQKLEKELSSSKRQYYSFKDVGELFISITGTGVLVHFFDDDRSFNRLEILNKPIMRLDFLGREVNIF